MPHRTVDQPLPSVELDRAQRHLVIGAALLALFLGALDALIVAAAMPTVVADMGGLPLYSWVYAAYFLARAIALPIFGKLTDRFANRPLCIVAISTFMAGSALAGLAPNMALLIAGRAVQGVGAGGVFALVYVVLSDIAPPDQRGKTLSLASSIWGIASVLGPTLGGLIVTVFSWRWVFLINLPLGALSLMGMARFLVESRIKRTRAPLDVWGALTLSVTILSVLLLMLMGGRDWSWVSWPAAGLALAAMAAAVGFWLAERRAADPVLPLPLFKDPGFRGGNLAVFFSSFAIFPLFAFSPLLLQIAQGHSPMLVGMDMLALSLGWSLGSLAMGQVVHRIGDRRAAVCGGFVLIAGCAFTLTFNTLNNPWWLFTVFLMVGVGMGFVTLSTLLVVQQSVDGRDLGVATSSHQFARTLGGTVGIGVCGGLVNARLERLFDAHAIGDAAAQAGKIFADSPATRLEALLKPGLQDAVPQAVSAAFKSAVVDGVTGVFWAVLAAAVICEAICVSLPTKRPSER